jgi:hypothetical protein
MRPIWLAAISCALASTASAQQQLGQFDKPMIRSAAKCELSRAAKALQKFRIAPQFMTAKITIETTTVDTKTVGADLKTPFSFLPSFGGKQITESTDIDQDGSVYGITTFNEPNCNRRNKVALGIYDSLLSSSYTDSDSSVNELARFVRTAFPV